MRKKFVNYLIVIVSESYSNSNFSGVVGIEVKLCWVEMWKGSERDSKEIVIRARVIGW